MRELVGTIRKRPTCATLNFQHSRVEENRHCVTLCHDSTETTMTTEAQYETRAVTAEGRYERLAKMLEQNVEMFRKAMKAMGAPLDDADLMIALAQTPPLGISESADRCRAAEEKWLYTVAGVLEDLGNLVEHAERMASQRYDGFTENGFTIDYARTLAELRAEAGVSAEDMATAISTDGDAPLIAGYVEGVEAGRYGLRWSEVEDWAALCGSSLPEVYQSVTGEELPEEKWPLGLRRKAVA